MAKATTLQELLDFVNDKNHVEYKALAEMTMDSTGLINFDERKYELSPNAMNCLAKLTGIPRKFFRELPADLRAVNYNYFIKRSEATVYVSISEDLISEIRNSEAEWTVQRLIEMAANAMGSDAYVIQPYLGQKSISFYVFREETENTVLGEVCKGIVVNTSVDKGKWCYANPILVNPLDETAIEFDVSELRDDAGIDRLDLEADIDFACHQGYDFIDRVLKNNSYDALEDVQHFASHYGTRVGLAVATKRAIVEEVMLAQTNTASGIALAVMMSEGRTSSYRQFTKLARMASLAFFAIDPEYCDHCHQELPEKEMTEAEAAGINEELV